MGKRERVPAASPPEGQVGQGESGMVEQQEGPLPDGSEEVEVPDTFDRKLQEWVTTEISEGDTPVVWLYRFTDNKASKEVCFKGTDILDAHEVGLRFGAGEYEILVQIPRSKLRPGVRPFKSYKFRCAKHYDDLCKERRAMEEQQRALLAPPAPSPVMVPTPQGQGLSEAIDVLAKLMQMMTPLLSRKDDTMSPALMAQMYGEVSRTMARSTIETHKMLTDSLRSQLQAAEGGEDDGEGEEADDPMRGIYELIAEYLPKLVGDGPGANLIAATVKKAPEFKKLLRDRGNLSKLLQYLDQTHGADKVNKALAKLGVNRPE